MKRLLSTVLCVLLIILPLASSQADSESGFEYSVTNGEAVITRYIGTAVGLSIPKTLGGYEVVAIGERAFLDCTTLKTVTITEGIASIDRFAFERCFGIETVIIPASVTEIGEGAFRYCYNLQSIAVSDSNPNFSSVEGVLFNKNGSVLLQYPTGSTQAEYTVRGTVREVGSWAFNSCSDIERIVIDKGVIIIGDSAFSACGALSEVVIATGVTSLGNWSFSSCEQLTFPTLPNTVEYIGEGAFYSCTLLESVTLPRSLKSLGQSAFLDCTELKEAYFEGNVPSKMDGTTFASCDEELTVFYHVDRVGTWSPNGETERFGLPIAPYGTHIVILGDADSDSEVSSADASHILRNIVKLVPDANIDIEAADVDKNGAVTAADAAVILRYVVRLITSF